MIVDCALYSDGRRADGGSDWRAMRARATAADDFVWIGMHEPTEEEIRDHSKERVAAYKYPRVIRFVEALPLGPTGKILKREITVD